MEQVAHGHHTAEATDLFDNTPNQNIYTCCLLKQAASRQHKQTAWM
jgi:hypothetical protein